MQKTRALMSLPSRFRLRLFIVLLVLLLSLAGRFRVSASGDLDDRIQQLHRKHHVEPENVGILLKKHPSDKTLYRQNAGRAFIPASNTKIVTALMALKVLGPGYEFTTRLYTDPSTGTSPNLYIRGGGDPSISKRFYENRTTVLERWARRLKEQGISSINKLILDDSIYTDREIHPSWSRYKLSFWYTAPVNAFILNENCVYVRVLPTSPGQPARVTVDPKGSPVRILNKTKTVSRDQSAEIKFKRLQGTWNIRVKGTIKPETARREWITVNNPVRFFGTVFERVLETKKLPVLNGVRERIIPKSIRSKTPVIKRTFSLTRTLDKMLKESQNLFAETIYKQVAYNHFETGSWKQTSKLTTDCLNSLGIPTKHCRFVDGSGLSRKNRLTPDTLVSTMDWWLENETFDQFIRYLPAAGQEGTMEHRLTEPPYRGHIRAKTGTLSDVITLSGIAGLDSGDGSEETVLFSVLINQPDLRKHTGRAFCDDVARIAQELSQ